MARSSARWVSAARDRSRTSNAPRRGSAQSDTADRLGNRAGSAQVTPVQDELLRLPRRQIWRGGKYWKGIAFARSGACERQVRLECARLRDEAGEKALGLHLRGQLPGMLRAHAELEPHHPNKATAFECPDITQ